MPEAYSVGFKRRMVERLRMGLATEAEICKQHEISLNLLREWSRWYERHFLRLHQISSSPMAYRPKSKEPKAQIAELQEQLKLKQKQLQDAELTAEMYKIIIRIASEELGVDLEKKFGSGQFPE